MTTMMIEYQREGGCLWHTDCRHAPPRSGIVRVVAQEPQLSRVECLHCGQQAYIRVGHLCARVLVINREAEAPEEEQRARRTCSVRSVIASLPSIAMGLSVGHWCEAVTGDSRAIEMSSGGTLTVQLHANWMEIVPARTVHACAQEEQ